METVLKKRLRRKTPRSDMPFSTSKADSLEHVNNQSFELYRLTKTITDQVKHPEQIVQFSCNLVNTEITNWHVNA